MAQLKLEKRGHTALITMANPPANTWTKETLTQLRDAVKSLEQDNTIYALVKTSPAGCVQAC